MVARAEGLGWAGAGWGTEMDSDDDGRMMMGMMMTKQLFAIVCGRQLELARSRSLSLSPSLFWRDPAGRRSGPQAVCVCVWLPFRYLCRYAIWQCGRCPAALLLLILSGPDRWAVGRLDLPGSGIPLVDGRVGKRRR